MKYILRALGLAFGALIYTIGLDVFLVPNHVIDGGVVGIALMAAQVTGISFSVFIIILNIPFFIFGYKKIGAFSPYLRSFHPLPVRVEHVHPLRTGHVGSFLVDHLRRHHHRPRRGPHHPLGRFPGRDGSPGHHR